MSRPRDTVVMDGGTPPFAWPIEPLKRKGGRNRPKVSVATRQLVFARDGRRCCRCGTQENLTIDHIKPLAAGGKNTASNMQTLCEPCNALKGDTVERRRR